MFKKLRSPRMVRLGILTTLVLFWGLVVWLVVALTGCAEPDRLAEVTATAEPSAQTATVTVDGEGVASDVTVTVIDPDDPDSAKQITESNVELPLTREVGLDAGEQVQVQVQNGTSGSALTATVEVDGQQITDTATGADVTVTAGNLDVPDIGESNDGGRMGESVEVGQ